MVHKFVTNDGILMPPTCKIIHVNMQHNYVHIRHIYVNMQQNYIHMQLNLSRMYNMYLAFQHEYMYVARQHTCNNIAC